MGTARTQTQGIGTQTAAINTNGVGPSGSANSDNTEVWNGTSWTTSPADLNTGREKVAAANQGTTKGPFTINATTEKISMRARGRQAKIRVATSTAGTSWRYGTVRLDIGKDGLR